MLERLKHDMEARALTAIVVAPVFILVITFLAIACFLALQETLAPPMAALVTAAAGIMLIVILLLIMRMVTSSGGSGASTRTPSKSAQPPPLGDQFEAILQERADPVLSNWIRDNPDKAMAATLVLGVAAGYSSSVQKVLLDLYRHYAAAESKRRHTNGEGAKPQA
ncbi:hypothetical protein [Wenzhouxiangella sp. XN24]|uniref:hypothetical protein n=1 Tax=Wenzhouxiangella sp. XN24 TaxID=2713569 RepID=UPI0013E9E127|nr:hypothetical protein [Wenzhouxiangella sp. XN24]NGX15344.1 hypothetical protein [Wenzhouxiangella sp. XN24]